MKIITNTRKTLEGMNNPSTRGIYIGAIIAAVTKLEWYHVLIRILLCFTVSYLQVLTQKKKDSP